MSKDECKEKTKVSLASVIVTTKNEESTIEQCVTSLLEQSYVNFEIIIIDAESSDWTYQILQKLIPISKQFPNCKRFEAITCSASTAAKGRNIGVSISRGEVIAFTDGDCVADRDWIDMLVRNLMNGVGMAGGPNVICHPKRSTILDVIDSVLKTVIGSGGSAQFSEITKATFISGSIPACNMGVKRELFEKVGGFDESLRYNEDTDLCQRVRREGYAILFTPLAKVAHFIGIDSFEHFARFMWNYGYQRGMNIPQHPRLFSKFYLVSVSFFLLFAWLIQEALVVPPVRLLVFIILLVFFTSIIAFSVRIGISNKSTIKGLMSVPIFLMIFFVYNSALLYGIFKQIIIGNRLHPRFSTLSDLNV